MPINEQDENILGEWKKTELFKLREKNSLFNEREVCNMSDYLKQKIFGALMIGLGVASIFLLDGDATFSILLIPGGLFTLFTKKDIFDEDDWV